MMNDYNMSKDLIKIIDYLLKLNERVIYRPHPIDLTARGNSTLINLIKDNLEKKKNFIISCKFY